MGWSLAGRMTLLENLNLKHLGSNEFEPNAFKGRADSSTYTSVEVHLVPAFINHVYSAGGGVCQMHFIDIDLQSM